jgi:hypothetical protein
MQGHDRGRTAFGRRTMDEIPYKDGLELWVWDTGQLEGFAVYLNGEKLDEQILVGKKYPIGRPDSVLNITVQFGGADGGATKIFDTTTKKSVAFQDAGISHRYRVK